MKYVARVKDVLHQVQKRGGLVDGEIHAFADMPIPDRVEIVPEATGGPYLMYRYTREGEFCGDTWHQTLEEAFGQATYEYGLREQDFLRVD